MLAVSYTWLHWSFSESPCLIGIFPFWQMEKLSFREVTWKYGRQKSLSALVCVQPLLSRDGDYFSFFECRLALWHALSKQCSRNNIRGVLTTGLIVDWQLLFPPSWNPKATVRRPKKLHREVMWAKPRLWLTAPSQLPAECSNMGEPRLDQQKYQSAHTVLRNNTLVFVLNH